ncbi:MAG: hypothetical protein M1337_04530 [Actinobacteria bacterium]|nr:hypothetical protein [Actinomycetota bacterium]
MSTKKRAKSETAARPAPVRLLDPRYLVPLIAALALAAFTLAPLLHSGFFGDDAINSVQYAKSALHLRGESLFGNVWTAEMSWMKAGRIFPLAAYGAVLFFLLNGHVLALKLFVMVLVLLNLFLLSYLTLQITESVALGTLALLLPPLLFQFRSSTFHDPILAFSGLLQVVLLYTLASLILLLFYLRSRRRRYLALSLIVYGVSLLTYEITIPFFLLHFAIVRLYPRSRRWLESARIAWPFAALAFAAVALAAGFRLYFKGFALSSTAAQYAQSIAAGADPAQGAYAPNYAMGPVVRTLAKQALAAIPLSYEHFATQVRGLFPGLVADVGANRMAAIVLVLGYGFMAWLIGSRVQHEVAEGRAPQRPGLLVVLGTGLLVLPNALISLSPRYQVEVGMGLGYLPVYVSYFGLTLLLAAALYGLYSQAAKATAWAGMISAGITATLVLAVVYVGVVNHENNRIDVETNNYRFWYPRALETRALQRGLFTEVPSGSRLIISGPQPWDFAHFFATTGGVNVTTVAATRDPAQLLSPGTPRQPSSDGGWVYAVPAVDNLYFLEYRAAWSDNGFVGLGRVKQMTVSGSGKTSILLEPFYLYISATPLASGAAELLFDWRGRGFTGVSPSQMGINPATVVTIGSGLTWALYRAAQGVTIQ